MLSWVPEPKKKKETRVIVGSGTQGNNVSTKNYWPEALKNLDISALGIPGCAGFMTNDFCEENTIDVEK